MTFVHITPWARWRREEKRAISSLERFSELFFPPSGPAFLLPVHHVAKSLSVNKAGVDRKSVFAIDSRTRRRGKTTENTEDTEIRKREEGKKSKFLFSVHSVSSVVKFFFFKSALQPFFICG
jgi:hypothetical protein